MNKHISPWMISAWSITEQTIYATLQIRVGTNISANQDEWRDTTSSLFSSPTWDARLSNISEPFKLSAPEAFEIKELRISLANISNIEMERFCFERVLTIIIGQKSYGQHPLALIVKPLEIVKYTKEPLFIHNSQQFRVSMIGPEFIPTENFDLVVGFVGTHYRGTA